MDRPSNRLPPVPGGCETQCIVRAGHGVIGRITAVFVASVTAALVGACGTTATPAARGTTVAPPPSTTAPTASSTTIVVAPTTTPPGSLCDVEANPDIVFTPGTGLCAVTTHLGVTIHVDLAAGYNWSDPVSTAAVIEIAGIERPSGGGLDAALYALRVGQAVVTATGTVACAPGVACPALALLWRLNVDVTG